MNDTILKGEKYVLYSLPFILLVGVTDYFIYKKNQLGKEFELYHITFSNLLEYFLFYPQKIYTF